MPRVVAAMSAPGTSLGTFSEHKCGVCNFVIPSPHGGYPPTSCLIELGGCGRTAENCDGHLDPSDAKACDICVAKDRYGETQMYPGNWGNAKIALYEQSRLSPYGLLLDSYKRIF